MSKEIQRTRMIREMMKRRVKNHEFAKMYIMSYTKRLSEIREVYGSRLHKERVYKADHNGILRATGVFEYWITPEHRTVTNAMKFEKTPMSNFMLDKLKNLRNVKS